MTLERGRGAIHLGDLARALVDLGCQDQTQASAVAACLGFGLRAPPSARPHRVFDPVAALPAEVPRPTQAPAPPVWVPPTPPRPTPLPRQTLTSRLTPLPGLAPPFAPAPDWLAAGADAFPSGAEPRLARATLLPERTARHVLAAALATRRPGGVLDLPRLIDAICRRAPLRRLPRRAEETVALGCQLLLDYSGPMVPFWEDLNDLADQVRGILGAAATRVYGFDTRPTQARHWTPAGEPRPWRPDGRPVLAATDLGIQGRAQAAPAPDWAACAADCAQAGSPLILLIPWPADRWPRTFPPTATLIHWGPRTTAGMVRRQATGHPR